MKDHLPNMCKALCLNHRNKKKYVYNRNVVNIRKCTNSRYITNILVFFLCKLRYIYLHSCMLLLLLPKRPTVIVQVLQSSSLFPPFPIEMLPLREIIYG